MTNNNHIFNNEGRSDGKAQGSILTFQLTSQVASDYLDTTSQKHFFFTSQALRLATLLHEIFTTNLFCDLGVCIFHDT